MHILNCGRAQYISRCTVYTRMHSIYPDIQYTQRCTVYTQMYSIQYTPGCTLYISAYGCTVYTHLVVHCTHGCTVYTRPYTRASRFPSSLLHLRTQFEWLSTILPQGTSCKTRFLKSVQRYLFEKLLYQTEIRFYLPLYFTIYFKIHLENGKYNLI